MEKKEAVCVTGGNGFIGSWVVSNLLNHGYTTIHASIFPGSSAAHLHSLPGASHATLVIHEADLLDFHAISMAVKGCSGVFHVASPCSLDDPSDPQKDLLDPAVKGTLNVLTAAKRFNVSAMVPNPNWPNHKLFDESSWTDIDFCNSRQKWYPVSKTLAEKSAWEFAANNGLDVVAILPSTCLGPILQPTLNASCAVLQQLLQGSRNTQEHHWLGAVHVKDVANAQLLLFETPSASGRYLCTNGIYQFGDFANRVSRLFPEFPVHRFEGETQAGMVSCEDAAKRLIGMGMVFTQVEDAVKDTVESLKSKGFLSHQPSQLLHN